jgi:hypothetical protein
MMLELLPIIIAANYSLAGAHSQAISMTKQCQSIASKAAS